MYISALGQGENNSRSYSSVIQLLHGFYIGKYTYPWGGGGEDISQCHLGENIQKEKQEKRGKIRKRKGNRGEIKGKLK